MSTATTATFTSGPWEMQERDDRERGIAIIAIDPDVPKGATPTRGMVAWVGQGGANFGNPPLQAANARLIAAAPDLLAALREARRALFAEYVGLFEHRTAEHPTIREIDAAIAKAEGIR